MEAAKRCIYHIADVIFSSAVIVFLSNYRFFLLTHILQVGDQIIVWVFFPCFSLTTNVTV